MLPQFLLPHHLLQPGLGRAGHSGENGTLQTGDQGFLDFGVRFFEACLAQRRGAW